MQKNSKSYKTAVCLIFIITPVCLIAMLHSYWVSFLPASSWQIWKWVVFLVFVSAISYQMIFDMRRRNKSITSLGWRINVGCLAFGWFGVEVTKGFMAVVCLLSSQQPVSYCASVTKHDIPIESLLPRVHSISVRIVDHGFNSDITFDYMHSQIRIDDVRDGDLIRISGDQSFFGTIVRKITQVANCEK